VKLSKWAYDMISHLKIHFESFTSAEREALELDDHFREAGAVAFAERWARWSHFLGSFSSAGAFSSCAGTRACVTHATARLLNDHIYQLVWSVSLPKACMVRNNIESERNAPMIFSISLQVGAVNFTGRFNQQWCYPIKKFA